MKGLFVALCILCLTMGEIASENGILLLNDDNFQKAVKDHELMFINFYSTGAPQSLAFTKTLEKILKNLEEKDMHPVIAKIDHYTNPKIAQIYRIGGFPVLYIFKKGSPRFYDGDLNEDDVQFFIEKGLEPGLIHVTTDEEIQKYVQRGFPTLVAHVNKRSSKEYKNFRKAASSYLDFFTLVVVGDSNVEVPMNQVYIYARGEKIIYDGKMTVKEMKKWITLKYLPAIIPYKRQYMKLVFTRENGVSDHLLFFADKDYFQKNPEIAAMFEKIAKDYVGRLFIVHISSDEAGLLDYFAVDRSRIPTFCLVKNGEQDVSKFAFRGAFEESEVRNYIESYFHGDLKPYFKSEPIYKEREGNVRILVHDDFEKVVYDPSVNVLVEFVTNNCRACDQLKDDYNTIAGYFVDIPDIEVARINISKNDVSNLEMKSNPMIAMYKAGGNGREMVVMERSVNLGTIMQFIGENRVTVNPQDALRHIMEDKAAEQEPEKPEEKPEEKVKVKEVRLDGDHMEVEL